MRRLRGVELTAADALDLLPVLRAGLSVLSARGELRVASRDRAQEIAALAVELVAERSVPKRRPKRSEAMPASQESAFTVGELAQRADVTEDRVTQFLRKVEARDGSRLPRRGRRYGAIPASVASEFLSQAANR